MSKSSQWPKDNAVFFCFFFVCVCVCVFFLCVLFDKLSAGRQRYAIPYRDTVGKASTLVSEVFLLVHLHWRLVREKESNSLIVFFNL